MHDVPRPELLEILADLSDLLNDLDRGRLTRYLRTPSPGVDAEATIEVLSIAAHDLDAIAEDLTSRSVNVTLCPDHRLTISRRWVEPEALPEAVRLRPQADV